MIQFYVEPRSIDQVESYLEQVRLRILSAIREGMMQSMQGLAGVVASKLHGDPIQSHSGELSTAVLASPRVKESSTVIRGSVSADVGQKHFGIWFDYGTAYPRQGVAGEGGRKHLSHGRLGEYLRSRMGLRMAPHPIMNPSLEQYKANILATISDRVTEAMAQS
jgi:hypothetical protein